MLEHSEKYDPAIRKRLNEADWTLIHPRLLKYATSRAKMFEWLGNNTIDPEMLVQEAIARAYGIGDGGTFRNWNTEKCPDLVDFLTGIIRSITSHRIEHETAFPKDSISEDEASEESFQKKMLGEFKLKTPEEEAIEYENLQTLERKLISLSNEDDELGMVVLCIEEGITEPRNIAKETGLDVKKVNNLLKKIRRKIKSYNPAGGILS